MQREQLVNIVMPTYNHDKYISQALDSVLMQECSFNYLIIIGEDCSTDTTRIICEKYLKNYPDKIVLLNNEANVGLIKNYKRIFDFCTAKYIAILESDDYWIDPLKLQKQIDIMEADDTIGLVHTRSTTLYENGNQKTNYHLYQSNRNNEELFSDILQGKYGIVPLTACFRRELIDKIDFVFCMKNDLKTIDGFLWAEFVMHTKFYFIDEVMGCYRNLESSVSNTKDITKIKNFIESSQKILLYYFRKYPIKAISEENLLVRGNYKLAIKYLDISDFENARKYSKRLPLNKIRFIWILLISQFKFLFPIYSLQKESIRCLSLFKQFVFRHYK